MTQEEWKNREEWESYWESRNHPHREMVLKELEGKEFKNVLEVGCASCPMLKRIYDKFGCEVYGIDISEKAIEMGRKNLPQAELKVGSAGKIPFEDNKFDLVVADGVLMYFNSFIIDDVLKEIKRVGKKYFLFVDFHNEKDIEEDGYSIYNYEKLLSDLKFKNIKLTKIPKEVWQGYCWENFGNIMTAEI